MLLAPGDRGSGGVGARQKAGVTIPGPGRGPGDTPRGVSPGSRPPCHPPSRPTCPTTPSWGKCRPRGPGRESSGSGRAAIRPRLT